MHTTSWWLTIPPAIVTSLSFAADDRRDGISALAYAMRTVAQLLLMCDRQDIGVSVDTDGSAMGPDRPATPDRLAGVGVSVEPRVFIYDNYPGGIGFSAPLYEMQARLLDATRDLIASCSCERGCPSCVGPVGEIGPLGKRVAIALLDRLTGVAFASDAEIVPF
jgi:DEAD/DEAH box helicase domain-containing protein